MTKTSSLSPTMRRIMVRHLLLGSWFGGSYERTRFSITAPQRGTSTARCSTAGRAVSEEAQSRGAAALLLRRTDTVRIRRAAEGNPGLLGVGPVVQTGLDIGIRTRNAQIRVCCSTVELCPGWCRRANGSP